MQIHYLKIRNLPKKSFSLFMANRSCSKLLQMSRQGQKSSIGQDQGSGADMASGLSEPGPSGSSQVSLETENEKFLKRKVEDKERRIKDLEKQVADNDAKKMKKIEFEDFIRDGESMMTSVQRRLRHQRRNQPFKVKETLKNIISEAEARLPKDIMDLMMKISGQNWPDNIQACIDFNTGGCTLAFSHQPKKQRHDQDLTLQHTCHICLGRDYFKPGPYI